MYILLQIYALKDLIFPQILVESVQNRSFVRTPQGCDQVFFIRVSRQAMNAYFAR